MKLDKWIALIACVALGALSFDALANTNLDWFSGSASGDAPSYTTTAASWNVPVGVTVDNSQFVLENDADSALLLTPDDTEPIASDGIVTVVTAATFVPVEELPESSEMGGAKIAMAVLATGDTPTYSYWGWGGTSWVKVADVLTADVASNDDEVTVTTAFTVVLNRRDGKVTFEIGTATKTIENIVLGSLSSVGAYGNGSLASIDADYELAVATGKDGKAYGSLAEANATTGDKTVAVVVSDAVKNEKAANGMPVVVCQALGLEVDQENAKPKFVPVAVDQNPEITLRLATATASIPVASIKYKVSKGAEAGTLYDMDKDILIPTDTGVYSIVPVMVQ